MSSFQEFMSDYKDDLLYNAMHLKKQLEKAYERSQRFADSAEENINLTQNVIEKKKELGLSPNKNTIKYLEEAKKDLENKDSFRSSVKSSLALLTECNPSSSDELNEIYLQLDEYEYNNPLNSNLATNKEELVSRLNDKIDKEYCNLELVFELYKNSKGEHTTAERELQDTQDLIEEKIIKL